MLWHVAEIKVCTEMHWLYLRWFMSLERSKVKKPRSLFLIGYIGKFYDYVCHSIWCMYWFKMQSVKKTC